MVNYLSSDEIKRQIIKNTDTSPLAKRFKQAPSITNGEQIEIGMELERVTKMPGWSIAEQYMINRMNLVGLATQDGSDISRGVAKAFIEFMQWIELCIQRKNELLEKENVKHEAKNVPKDEGE